VVDVGKDIVHCGRAHVGVGQEGRAEVDAYDTAQLPYDGKVAVTQVAGMSADLVGIGVRGDKGLAVLPREGNKVIYGLLGCVRHVRDDAALEAPGDQLLAEIGQSALRVVRAADAGLTAPHQRHVPDTFVLQNVQPLDVPGSQPCVLHGKDGGCLSCRPCGVQLRTGAHLHGAVGESIQFRLKIVGDL